MSSAEYSRADPPRVCIGMPVYNEARFIESALDSLLAQDYGNLEILISDNASTDATGRICERLSATDPRIRYRRQAANLGAAANFRWVLEHGGDGDYFMWCGGHDLWSATLVSRCVASLEAAPGAAIAVPTSRWIDGDGKEFGRHYGYTDTRGMHPLARFFTVFWGNMHPILGLIRARCLRATAGFQPCVGADLILLEELALAGDFVHVPGVLWSRREPRGDETHDQKLRRYTSAEYGITRAPLDRLFPLLRLPLELSRVAWASPLPWHLRLATVLAIAASLPARYLAGKN